MRSLGAYLERRRSGPEAVAPQVNLLPADVQLATQLRSRVRWWGLLLGVGVGGLALSAFSVRSGNFGTSQLRTLLNAEEERIRQEERSASRLAAQAEVLRRRCTELLRMRSVVSYSRLLRELAQAVPPEALLRKVEFATLPVAAPKEEGAESAAKPKPPRPAAPIELRIEGLAMRYDALVGLHDVLRNGGEYRDVSLVRSGVEQVGSSRLFAFAFTCRR